VGGGGGGVAFCPALSRRYRLRQSERKISQNSGYGTNLSAYIDMMTLWRDTCVLEKRPAFRKKAVDRPDRSACVLCPPGGTEFVTFSVRGPNARSVAYACRTLWLAAKPQVWKTAFKVKARAEKSV
jgi:hypothetical protein